MKLFQKIAAAATAALALVASVSHGQLVTLSDDPEHYAWWLRLEIEPIGLSVRDVPVNRIHPDWCKANEFAADQFPSEVLYGNRYPLNRAIDTLGFDFSLTVQGDGTATYEMVLGVYETCLGDRGTFLAVIGESDRGVAEPLYVQSFANGARFAILRPVTGTRFQLWWCFGCDDFLSFRWSGENGALDQL